MSSSTPRIITIALATLALAAPAATAMPLYEHGEQAAPKQDLRNPDQQAPAPAVPKQDLRNPDNQAPGIQTVPAQQPSTYAPVERTKPPAVVHDSNPSPLVFILPSLVLLAMLAAATVYAKSMRPARRSLA
jgi:hypothetical protein